jgi:hypothetical protein
LDACQENIEVDVNLKELHIPYRPPPTAPYCKYRTIRDVATGKVLSVEEIFVADHGSAVNSVSSEEFCSISLLLYKLILYFEF